MAITSGIIVLNAAFLQEIKEDDVLLRQLLDQARQRFENRRWLNHSLRDTWRMLEALRDQLATHFTLEEACGYLETSLEEVPELSEQAARLKNEHGPLFQQICDLCEKVAQGVDRRRGPDWLTPLVDEFWCFWNHLRRHEQQEQALIFQAFQQDTGVGD